MEVYLGKVRGGGQWGITEPQTCSEVATGTESTLLICRFSVGCVEVTVLHDLLASYSYEAATGDHTSLLYDLEKCCL